MEDEVGAPILPVGAQRNTSVIVTGHSSYLKRQQAATSKPKSKQETSEDSRSKVYAKAHNNP